MTIQTLFDAWITSGAHHNVQTPATESEIQAAETKIGVALPELLCEVYQLFNGGWMWDVDFFSLEPPPKGHVLTEGNETYIEYGWHIPKEIRLFAEDGGGGGFAIWLPACGNPIYNHPVIEVGELPGEDGCMGVAGTNLLSFLRGWSAYHLVYDERYELAEGREKLSQIQTALDTLQVPQSLRGEYFDDERLPFRRWADPQLPDPSGDAYSQQYTITDLKRLFDAV